MHIELNAQLLCSKPAIQSASCLNCRCTTTACSPSQNRQGSCRMTKSWAVGGSITCCIKCLELLLGMHFRKWPRSAKECPLNISGHQEGCMVGGVGQSLKEMDTCGTQYSAVIQQIKPSQSLPLGAEDPLRKPT